VSRTPQKREREHGADKRANSVIALAMEVKAYPRTKLARPAAEVPSVEVLVRVGLINKLTSQAHDLAQSHRKAVAEQMEAVRRRDEANVKLAETERQLGIMRRRAETAEAEVRRRKLAAGEDVA
jgi:hypothetical protein